LRSVARLYKGYRTSFVLMETSVVTKIENRLTEFGAAYEDFESDDVRKMVIATGDWLEKLMGTATAGVAMKSLFTAAFRHSPQDNSWRQSWEGVSINDVMLLPKADLLVNLSAFAFWGLPLRHEGTIQENEAVIGEAITEVRTFVDAVPAGWGDFDAVKQTVEAAECRWLLDHDQDVTQEQLAAVARISLKTLKNLLTPSNDSGLKLNREGKIPSAAALAWLKARDDFRDSVWRERLPDEDSSEPSHVADLGPIMFVPVAKEGSWFSPDLRRAGHYVIGPKGAEENVDEYEKALNRLSRMATPRWRRPNNEGNWGIVSGVRWERRIAAEIGISQAAP
jgi:hypothetical protein